MSDGNLRILFRRNLPHFFWTSIESYTEPGIPDTYYCRDRVCGWIEFKKTGTNRIYGLSPEQVSWHAAHARKGGRSFFFIRRRDELHAYAGHSGSLLNEQGLAARPSLGFWTKPWAWEEIERVLLGQTQ